MPSFPFALAPKQSNGLIYTGYGLSLIPAVEFPRAPTSNDTNYPLFTIWRNSNPNATLPDALGDMWFLSYAFFTGTLQQAKWLKLASSSGPSLLNFVVPLGSSPVFPTVSGQVTLTSSGGTVNITGSTNTINFDVNSSKITESLTGDDSVAVTPTGGTITVKGVTVANATNAKPLFVKANGTHEDDWQIQVGAAIASTNINNAGIVAVNSAQFTCDGNGFVSLIGGTGPVIQGIVPDAHTAPGTSPVVPNGSGNITVTGGQVAAGTTTNAIQTNSLAANTYTIQVQRSQATASSTVGDNGVCHFNSAHFTVDTNGFVSSTAFTQQGVANLGIALSGTTLTVQGANGSSLSSSNPGYVTLQSLANPGQLKTYTITANQSFTQAQLGNNLFGLSTAINATNDIPFYLYAVSNANNGENTITFMISRIPHRIAAPLAANIAQSGNTNATTQGSFYSLNAITAADYASSPCLCIGSFRQTYSSSLWTVSTLGIRDGINQFNNNTPFTFNFGQFGSAGSTTPFSADGGSAPGGATPGYVYYVRLDGSIDIELGFPCNVSGVGAVNLALCLPFFCQDGGNIITGLFISPGATSYNTVMGNIVNPPGQIVNQILYSSGVYFNQTLTNGSGFTINGRFNASIIN